MAQPISGFRAGTDTVLLASAVAAKSGDTVLELGCGAGVALCCLGVRVQGLDLLGVEQNAEMAQLARENLSSSQLSGEIFHANVFDMPIAIREKRYHHVMMNPPFYDAQAFTAPKDDLKSGAHMAQQSIGEWLKIAKRRVAPKGVLTVIHRAEALKDILSSLNGFGDISVLPISKSPTSEAKTIIVRARAGARGKFVLQPYFHTHNEDGVPSKCLKDITERGYGMWDVNT